MGSKGKAPKAAKANSASSQAAPAATAGVAKTAKAGPTKRVGTKKKGKQPANNTKPEDKMKRKRSNEGTVGVASLQVSARTFLRDWLLRSWADRSTLP